MSDEQLNEFFAAARQDVPDTARAEYGFETRLLARIRAEREQLAPWYACAWRLVPVFAALVVALGVWTWATPDSELRDLHSALTGNNLFASTFAGE